MLESATFFASRAKRRPMDPKGPTYTGPQKTKCGEISGFRVWEFRVLVFGFDQRGSVEIYSTMSNFVKKCSRISTCSAKAETRFRILGSPNQQISSRYSIDAEVAGIMVNFACAFELLPTPTQNRVPNPHLKHPLTYNKAVVCKYSRNTWRLYRSYSGIYIGRIIRA